MKTGNNSLLITNLAQFDSIPATTKEVVLCALSLGFKEDEQVKAYFSKLPTGLWSLDLGSQGFYRKDTKQLCDIFSSLPKSLTKVSFTNLGLHNRYEPSEVTGILSSLPKSVSEINFKLNWLGGRLTNEGILREVLATLPRNVAHLNLEQNRFVSSDATELSRALSSLSPSIITLDLSLNELGVKSGDELKSILSSIPQGVIDLNLTQNLLYEKTGNELKDVFSSLPVNIASLRLDHNKFGKVSKDKIINLLSALGENITELSLGHNKLGSMTGDELCDIFSALPAGVTKLSLFSNKLKKLSTQSLILAFSHLPKTITSLNIAGNGIDSIPEVELKAILSALPSNITSLDLGNYVIGEPQRSILSTLPDSVTNISVSEEQLDKISSLESSLFPEHLTTITLKYRDLKNGLSDSLKTTLQALPESIHTLRLEDDYCFEILSDLFKAVPAHIKIVDFGSNDLTLHHGVKRSRKEMENIFAAIPSITDTERQTFPDDKGQSTALSVKAFNLNWKGSGDYYLKKHRTTLVNMQRGLGLSYEFIGKIAQGFYSPAECPKSNSILNQIPAEGGSQGLNQKAIRVREANDIETDTKQMKP